MRRIATTTYKSTVQTELCKLRCLPIAKKKVTQLRNIQSWVVVFEVLGLIGSGYHLSSGKSVMLPGVFLSLRCSKGSFDQLVRWDLWRRFPAASIQIASYRFVLGLAFLVGRP
jgi:hypothetical protein